MTRPLVDEVKRVNFNLLWVNALVLAAALGVGGIPFMLGVAKATESYFWYVLAAPFFLLGAWNLEKALRRGKDLESHPFLEKLKGQGFGVIEAVDQDLDRAQEFLGFALGRAWLLRRSFFKLELEALSDALWAYSRTSHSDYVIYSQPVVHFRSGKKLSGDRTAKSQKVELFLSQLSQAAPWIIQGENDDVAKLWTKDRQNFIEQIDQRRKVLESQRRRGAVPE